MDGMTSFKMADEISQNLAAPRVLSFLVDLFTAFTFAAIGWFTDTREPHGDGYPGSKEVLMRMTLPYALYFLDSAKL